MTKPGPWVDLLVAEPVFYDGTFGIADPAALPRARRALPLDTTLVGAKVDLRPMVRAGRGSIQWFFVVNFASCLQPTCDYPRLHPRANPT
jgi:hypothetical protein